MALKPQLVSTQDFGGAHNADLDGSRARLTKGGSWKRQRIITILPSSDKIPAKVALSMWNMAYPPNNPSYKILALGQEVGEAYSNAIAQVLAHPDLGTWEYILTIEHDNMPPADGILRLLEQMEEHPELHVISGLYFTKGPGGVAQIWGDPRDPVLNFRPQLPVNDALIECCGTGMGFALWRLSMFKDEKLRRPWFVTQTKGGIGTQDLYFATDARKHGYRFAVDCAVKVGHYDLEGAFGIPDYVW